MGKNNFLRFTLAVLAVAIISQIFHMADGFIGLKYYMDPAYAAVWSKFMMPNAGPPPPEFFYMSVMFNLIGAIIFVFVYKLIKSGLTFAGDSAVKKGAAYGFLMFLAAGVTGMLAMYLIINLPLGLVLLWVAEDFVIKLAGGAAMAVIVK